MFNAKPGLPSFGKPIRPHWKVLIWPATKAVLLLAAELTVLVMLHFGHGHPGASALLGVLAAVGLVWWLVLPYLRWFASTYTVTRGRLIIRSGIFGFKEVTLGLSKVVSLRVEVSASDQFFGTGTLVVEFPGKHGEVKLPNIPQVDYWNAQLNQLLWPEPAPKPELVPKPELARKNEFRTPWPGLERTRALNRQDKTAA